MHLQSGQINMGNINETYTNTKWEIVQKINSTSMQLWRGSVLGQIYCDPVQIRLNLDQPQLTLSWNLFRRFTLISLRSHPDFTSMSLWFHFDVAPISRWPNSFSRFISFQFHFELTSISQGGKTIPRRRKTGQTRRTERERGKGPPTSGIELHPATIPRTHERKDTISNLDSTPQLRWKIIYHEPAKYVLASSIGFSDISRILKSINNAFTNRFYFRSHLQTK